MTDEECVAFLQWALPRLGLRWAGYRKVRRQVCKRIGRRLGELALPDPFAYRAYLQRHPEEWAVLDRLCPITISRFYRDRDVFDYLRDVLLPELAQATAARGEETLRALSLGCASGEEPYTLMLLWRLGAAHPAEVALQVLATDVDETLLARAQRGCYPAGSLKGLPAGWIEQAFERCDESWCLRPAYREGVTFLRQDVREALPPGPFDLVLCRNLVFTYFDEAVQRRCLARLLACLRHGGALVVGRRERLPAPAPAFTPARTVPGVYRKA